MRHQPCFCTYCERSFHARTGAALPRAANWNDPLYREWIMWNYARRLEIWDHFNRVTREAGGEHCIWVGMMAGAQNWQSRVFRDDREVYRRTPMIMLDHQRRFDSEGFQHNAETGKRRRVVISRDFRSKHLPPVDVTSGSGLTSRTTRNETRHIIQAAHTLDTHQISPQSA
jgi:hypothetical protein